ncbi:Murein DD-endopeptidase MepM and murein hydrolase activator NlpD, contain LysM domain [Flexibacter flexilis DSM 6793]|uniref:Murein DD-endopeptidase MepM and murein hydrolase activator NlpD, contain LysM domain n=1 Tax=Flexibacter flexilis DSM 6793 TaxID=927664 RepID=A0A1I1DP54_9BACT|nr:M23 family metallopeptidase [Flexibacter flexilis]SFB76681.1 Murein DD-endopeptidase MepM and murein hydrolase activator NlpD, contain LysM domain [Flexibacter flexilis DSM 6793]
MAKIKYYYNTHTCTYEKVRTSAWDILFNISAFIILAALAGAGAYWFGSRFFESGREAALRKENEELKFYYELLGKELNKSQEVLASLQTRDDNIYRVIFEADPIPAAVRGAGIGGANHYKDLLDKGLEQQELIINTFARADKLKKQLYVQAKSYDEITGLVKNKQKMLACLPAIQPVRNSDINMLAGFGGRIDPVYKTPKFHSGMDFGAKTGSKIYATGKGVVSVAGYGKHLAGYGQCVVINHGYGYQTLYGHMSKVKVRVGQRINRGDVIGLVGSTGKSTGPHLHYEVIKGGQKINPVNFYYNDISPKEYQNMLDVSSRQSQTYD